MRISWLRSRSASRGGWQGHRVKARRGVNEVIRREFPEAKRIASNLKEITCATFNPDELTDPRELNGTDVSVVEGSFGVAGECRCLVTPSGTL